MDGRSRSLSGLAVPAVAIVALIVAVSFFVVFQPQGKNETSPFRINSDAEMVSFASRMGWPGNGSIDDPFIIDGLSMKTGSSAPSVYIGNTSYHFVLSHCLMKGTYMSEQYSYRFVGHGIELFNLRNGTIRNNILINCSMGISLEQCSACDLINNSVYDYPKEFLLKMTGIRLDNSSLNTIRDNEVVGHFEGSDSDQNQVIDNQFTGYSDCIHLLRCNSTRLDHNSIWAKELPIHIMVCSGCLVLNNNITSLGQTSLFEAVENMRFENNTFKTIGGVVSMELRAFRNNYLINNKFDGSLILFACYDNLIEKNQLSHWSSFYEITISGGWSNKVQGNRISSNGVELIDIETNQIVGNEITYASRYGIILTNATNNTCISNMLKGCHGSGKQRNPDLVQASDDTGSNRWNDSMGGNFWSDWTGALTEQPYPLDGGAGAADLRPLSVPPII
ncbi:MAG: NosD domain-containing protein [Methanomassiliicoccales archaeon]